MRIFGIVAVFVLTLVAILEGAALVRLSGRVDSLVEKLETAPVTGSSTMRVMQPEQRAAAGGTAPGEPRGLPRLMAAPAGATAADGPATAVLREALETPEGRSHLKAAMEVLREQDRQDRLLRNAEENVADEQRYRERLTRLAALTPDEQNRVSQLHTAMSSARQRVLEEMRAGGKSAEQADDEIDNLEDETNRQIRTLLGEQRMQKFREAARAERRRERGQGEGGAGNQGRAPPPGAGPLPAGATPP
jgi:hypothetical protein